MTVDQVMKMPKIDAHAHIGASGPGISSAFVAFLEQYNLRWLNICMGGMDWTRLTQQIERAQELHRAHPAAHRLGDLVQSRQLGPGGLGDRRIAHHRPTGYSGGAVAVKVWKDVGMVLKDPDGRFVMIDDPRLDPGA